MKHHIKRIAIVFLGLALLLLMCTLFLISPFAQLYSKTGFLASPFVTQLYAYDAVGEGHDYDGLKIFLLLRPDQIHFTFFALNHPEWALLPCDETILNSEICNVEYNPQMQDMLNVEHGFWYYKEQLTGGQLFIYDVDSGKIYLRMANCFVTTDSK